MKRLVQVVLTVLAVGTALLTAEATRGNDDPRPSRAVFAAAPAASRNRANPYAGNQEALLAGRKLYLNHCAACHGKNANGTPHGPSLVSEFMSKASPGEIEWFIRNGNMRRAMPSWSGLPKQRRWQITTYLTSLQSD